MATINTTTWQYTYTDKNWKTQTATIKNWSNVTDSQVQQLTNAANNSGGRMTVTNDTSNAGYWKQRWTGNLMYNWQAAITNMASDGNGYAITTYSDWTKSYNNQATWEKISENTYKSILANTNALWLNSSVKGLSNTYNTYWDLWGASSKPKYQWFGTMTGYNPALTTANLGTWYQFWTMAEQAEKNSPWYLEWRNNELASALLNSGITDQAWIRNFLSQYEWFNSYDPTGQNNTVQAIYNRIGQMQSGLGNKEEDMLGDQIMQGQYRDTVNSILNSAFGIGDMDSIKDMYGSDVYYSMMNALKDVEWTWNATDPASRSQLQWYLQEIIGSAVWTWVDQSKLNLAMNAILSNFTDAAQKQIQQDVLAVQNLQTKWMSADQIAKQTWMSKDQVNQLVLLSQWMPSQIWKYYEMNNDAEEFLTEDYERNRENLEQQYKFNLEVANQELTQMREDFNKTYLDQQEANENTLHNMDLIAWMTGTWYSRRWLEWMSYAQQQANAVLNNLMDNYDRNNLDIANSIKSMTMAYQQNDAELVDQMNDAILNAKNNYIAQVSNIQSKYWLVWLEWQQAIAQAVQWFVDQAETIYNNAFNRAWTNTNNLISAVSSIWAIEQQQMQTKQMKIAEFQQDSMYMTQNQLRDYAQKNGLQMEYQQLVWYQQEATINTLNSVSPWLWNQYANKINQMLSKWYTPQQAVSEILNSPEVQSSTGGNRAVSGDYIYDKNTWEVRSLAQMTSGGYSTQQIQQAVVSGAQSFINSISDKIQNHGKIRSGWCWTVCNDYLASLWLWTPYWDSKSSKLDTINSSTPTVWSIAVWNSTGTDAWNKYGHVAIVVWVDNANWKITVLESNEWTWLQYKDYNMKNVTWYNDPSITLAQQYGWTQENRDTDAYRMAQAILNGTWRMPAKNSKEYTAISIALDNLVQDKRGTWYPEWMELINYSIINDDPLATATAESIASTMSSLYSTDTLMKTLEDNNYKVWPIINKFAKLNPRDADYASIKASINQMASNIARWFWEKWVLTDQDIERYMKTIPNEKMWKNAREVVWTLLKAKLYSSLIYTLEAQAKNKKDVSMYASDYQDAVNWLVENWFREWSTSNWWGRGMKWQ